MSSVMDKPNAAVEKFLAGLTAGEARLPVDWEQWLQIGAPYAETATIRKDVTTRFARNGYDWDMHGSLFLPEKEHPSGVCFVMFHGGAGSENIFDRTPDGRPGLARVLASQGFPALALTYVGHWSPKPNGDWETPVPERQPIYLLDRDLPLAETLDRNLKCTFNVHMQGAAALADRHFAGRKVIAFGHSTGGPMAALLHRAAKKIDILGIVGFGSGGPDGWRRQWRLETGAEKTTEHPLEKVSRRSPSTFKASGYEDPADLCPGAAPINISPGPSASARR